jgi:flagellar protein FliJ
MTSSSPRPGKSGSAALDAVARVRSMRERDSLFGLHTALTDARRDQERVESLDSRLDAPLDVTGPEGQPIEAFLEARGAMLALGSAITTARAQADTTDAVALAARSRWQHDRTQLDAISQLMEQRATELRGEVRRREARDLDEIAGQRWARDGGAR